MTDYSLFAQPDGYRSNNHERITQSVLTSNERRDADLIQQLPRLNIAQSFPRHFFSGAYLPPQLANIRRTAERFIVNPLSHSLSIHHDDHVHAAAKKQDVESCVFSDEIEDADFATCVLKNLPTSYDDFETKELHLKLERNLSSPLMTCQSPNTDSGRVSAGSSLNRSSNMYPCDSAGLPPDADDMEVAMINESFEEQQKQNKLYENPGLKDLFYSQPNVPSDEHKGKHTNSAAKRAGITASNPTAAFESGIFVANHPCFGVAQLQTSNVNNLLITRSELPDLSSSNIQQMQPSQMLQDSFDLFNVSKKSDNKFHESRLDFVQQLGNNDGKAVAISTAEDKMDATEALAVNVVESLFANVSLAESPALQKSDQRMNKADNGTKYVFILPKSECKSDAVDSWEELDNDNFNSKLDDAIQSAVCKVRMQKPKIDYTAPPPLEPWDDDDLPHVLEAYGLPVRYSEVDVKQELAKYDCADICIHPVDESRCLVVFSSANAALKALLAVRQHCTVGIHLRPLCDATPGSQKKARQYHEFLLPYKPRPQTTTLVARRLIEGALGKRSNVSSEVIRAERKQLKDAKESKQAKAALWESTL